MEYILTTPSIVTLAGYFILFFAIPMSGSGLEFYGLTPSKTQDLQTLAFLVVNQKTKMSLFVTLGLSYSHPTRCTFFEKNSILFNDYECEDNGLLI